MIDNLFLESAEKKCIEEFIAQGVSQRKEKKMKGIYYNRQNDCDNDNEEDWHQSVEGIVVDREVFLKFFPEIEIQGEIEWECDNHSDKRCEDCDRCGHSVKFSRQFVAIYSNEHPTHQIGKFEWHWHGAGAREHWFDDEAVCLKKVSDYRSNTGLTADSTRIVVFNRKIEVASFRGDCADETKILPKPDKILAEFVNSDGGHRANWTGFAVGAIESDDSRYTPSGGWTSSSTPIIGDDLDEIIEILLSGEVVGKATVCKHNKNVQAHIITADPKKIPLYLCKSCRMRGVRWEEFAGRNHADTCPYFRRACKSVVEKSDQFPEWFKWSGDNLLQSTLRMQNGEYLAYEVTYVRRKEGFVRRAVLLLNARTHEAWMYRYNGYIAPTIAEFRGKYTEGRQVLGYMGTGPEAYSDTSDRFLSEAMVAEAIAQGLEQPLWQNGNMSLISFNLDRDDLRDRAIKKGHIGDLEITQFDSEEEEIKNEEKENPSPFYTDEGANYFLIYNNWRTTVLQKNDEKLFRSERNNKLMLFRVEKH